MAENEPKPESPAELAAEAKRLLTVATNASFDCGQWDEGADEDDSHPSYETLAAAANKARQDVHTAIDRLAALAIIQASRELDLTRAELEIYRSTYGQQDTGMAPNGQNRLRRLTDAQHLLALNVKVKAERAMGRGTGIPLHERREILYAAIEDLAALVETQASASASQEPGAWLTVCGPTAGCGAQYASNLANCPNCGKLNFSRPAGTSVIVAATQARPVSGEAEAEPVWIVNDLGELGVKVNGRFFFLYKGDNIEYGSDVDTSRNGVAIHDEGDPMRYRSVGKREFGEVQWPARWLERGFREDRYTEELQFHPGLSFGKPEDGAWHDLPAAPTSTPSAAKKD